MKKNSLLFLTLLFLLSFVQQSDFIFWNPKRPLRFEDFKVVQKDTIQIGNTGRFKGAQSQLKFKFNSSQSSYTKVPQIEVLVYFIPDDSWMLIKDERTLEHEQIHFNIAELYARKMRKSIDSLNKLNVYDFQVYKDNINDWSKKYDNYDILFDQEIDDRLYYLNGKVLSHKDKGQQKLWKEKVDKELKMLQEFEQK